MTLNQIWKKYLIYKCVSSLYLEMKWIISNKIFHKRFNFKIYRILRYCDKIIFFFSINFEWCTVFLAVPHSTDWKGPANTGTVGVFITTYIRPVLAGLFQSASVLCGSRKFVKKYCIKIFLGIFVDIVPVSP